MNQDTERSVAEIKTQRWYPKSKALGAGGWGAVYQFAANWKTYIVSWPGSGETQPIVAEDDQVAWRVFADLYFLPVASRVCEKIVTYRHVPRPKHRKVA